MRAHIAELGRVADTLICAYPNAGLPNEFGHYDEGPDAMAAQIGEFAASGPRQHRRRLLRHHARPYPRHRPRRRRQGAAQNSRQSRRGCGCPASKPFTLTPEIPFVNVGERTNVTGSARFRKLVTAGDYPAALAVARDQVENGAQIIDINMDEGLLDSEKAMITFLNLVAAEPDIARVPVMINSSKFSVIEAGLKCVQGKAVVNSISLKEGEDAFIRHAETRAPLRRRRRGHGVRRSRPGRHARDESQDLPRAPTTSWSNRVGFPPQDIIFDPNIFAVATGMEEHNGYGVAFIEAARWIRQNLPHAHVSGGVSNFSFSFRGNEAGARGDAFGVPLSRHRGRHGYGHRQCRPDRGL